MVTMISTVKTMLRRPAGVGLLVLCCWLVSFNAYSQVPLATNTPIVRTAAVLAGDTGKDIFFDIDGIDEMLITVIVPVPGAEFTLLGPDNSVVVSNAQANYVPGADIEPTLPGGVFQVESIPSPDPGSWTIRLAYPSAPENTAVMATINLQSQYEVGLAIPRHHINTGEELALGLLVLDDGVPIEGLTPVFSLKKDDVTIASGLSATDDGSGLDALADDGIYSTRHTFADPGEYIVSGVVAIPGGGVREAAQKILVSEPRISIDSIDNLTVPGDGGCTESFIVRVNADIAEEGIFIASAEMDGDEGLSIPANVQFPETTGPVIVDIVFSAEDMLTRLGSPEEYSIHSLRVIGFDPDIKLAHLQEDIGAFASIVPADFCLPPVVISTAFGEEPELGGGDGFTGITIGFPVHVKFAGEYTIRFSIIGPAGEDIGDFEFIRELSSGENIVSSFIPSDHFAGIDGPYRIINIEVAGQQGSDWLSILGETRDYKAAEFASPPLIFTDSFE